MTRHILRYLRIPSVALLTMIVAGLLIAHLGLFLTGWQTQRKAFDAAQQTHRDATAQLRDLRSRRAIAERVEEARTELQTLDGLISHPLDQAQLVSQTNRLVRRAAIDVVHGDNTLVAVSDNLMQFRQELTVEGSYAGIRYFLHLLEGSDYLNVIEEVDWKPQKAGKQKARVKLVTFLREGQQ
ncbi:hypothetical protein [Aliiroseovarius crassostreae]|uniref:hypothetical protein n=1 Tax=Aliiroseovarius crassostreae TaxID=154981 RepID=UPI00220F9EC6|nr:hypothetical protein [Aliiroseovarius crassostreae]UWQ00198.1 hypothetical protein K3X53_15515 [Aliiroseovarius crassostreae]